MRVLLPLHLSVVLFGFYVRYPTVLATNHLTSNRDSIGWATAVSLHSFSELVELARMCWRQAHLTSSWEVAAQLRQMAREYQQEAAKLDSGKLPAIGDPATDGKQVE